MPGFTSCHSEQSYDCRVEVLEIGVNVNGVLQLYSCEDLNTKHRVNKQNQEEEASNIGQLIDSSDESLEKNS